uniref:Uncharacterized protein n=1 Tax=Ananas comosus var. bracteatus TaxID=296719 RepID=A0A6V7NJM0_ANACO|nr:unnamed protein product [Ananas comosus var. bracteatus]
MRRTPGWRRERAQGGDIGVGGAGAGAARRRPLGFASLAGAAALLVVVVHLVSGVPDLAADVLRRRGWWRSGGGGSVCRTDPLRLLRERGEEWEHVDGGEAEEDAAGELGFLGFPERTFVPVMFSQVAEDGYASNLEQNAADKELIPAAKSGGSSDEFSAESHSDWIEPTMNLYTSSTSLLREREKVYDAFRLLQINPSVQKMNDVVQEFKKSFCEDTDGDHDTQISDENPAGSGGTDGILGMIFGHTKAKILELIDKIGMLFNKLFHSQEKPQNSTFIDDALRSSFMLTVIVFLIVVATRVEKA